MPIKNVTWICSTCSLPYSSEETAVACEAKHFNIVSTKPEFYKAQDPRYPEQIIVTFSDGKTITYYK
jgi:hypothetical protein